jgi:hypothetical protein
MILSRVDRAKDYGDAHQNFLNISKGWSVIFGVNVAPEKVALAMDWLKTCRLITARPGGEGTREAGAIGMQRWIALEGRRWR